MIDNLVYLHDEFNLWHRQEKGYPHVVDHHSIDVPGEVQNLRDLTAADGITTVIYHYNRSILSAFLDRDGPDIHFDRSQLGKCTLYIGRKGRYMKVCSATVAPGEVCADRSWQCGYYYRTGHTINWEICVEYYIGHGGKWSPISATGTSCGPTAVDDIDAIDDFGKNIATTMLMERQWENTPHTRIMIT